MTKENEAETAADQQESAAPEQDNPPHMSDINGVRYVGRADRKVLTISDLEGVGVTGLKADLVWDNSNNKLVRVGDINASARDWFATQPDFIIE